LRGIAVSPSQCTDVAGGPRVFFLLAVIDSAERSDVVGGEMTDLDEARVQYHRALEAFIGGEPEPVQRLVTSVRANPPEETIECSTSRPSTSPLRPTRGTPRSPT
jgi:hypothetical protein